MIRAYVSASTAAELAELLQGKKPDELVIIGDSEIYIRKLYSDKYVLAEDYFKECVTNSTRQK